jgi:hypothetical protein
MTKLTNFKRFGANPPHGISLAVTIRSDLFVKCHILVVLDQDRPFVNAIEIMGIRSHFSMVLMEKRTSLMKFAALMTNVVCCIAERRVEFDSEG